jgi:arylsulfatase A-like enzyme
MVLHEANYSVTHSGKWHLGGMRNDDLDMRLLPVKPPGQPGGRRCPHPGPNQQGFKNYVSVLDGPGSPRQNRLQLSSHLYSEGCTALLHNDVDIGNGAHNVTGFLTYCEAEHAIQAMKRSVTRRKPFYVQLWFHAPHSPLEEIPGWFEKLTGNASTKPLENQDMFRTMVADMDHQIGRVLDSLESLGIEQNTLVIFTSDNGPEPFAGSRAGLKGAKRYLYEGGIRVPAIVQWTGTIPAGQSSDAFVVSTDLFPTFLDAAGVLAPPHLRLDGLSILPLLVPDYYKDHSIHPLAASVVPAVSASSATSKHAVDEVRLDEQVYRAAMRDRVTLWHNDYEGQRRSAAWVYGYKVILDENEHQIEMYDVDTNMYEARNLAAHARPSPVPKDIASAGTVPGAPLSGKGKVTLDMVLTQRNNVAVHTLIATRLSAVMQDYVRHGSDAHILQKQANPGWNYSPTLSSDMRTDLARGRETPKAAEESHFRMINGTCGVTPCSCEVKTAKDVPSLPFEKTNLMLTYLHPGKLLNGAQLLGL